MIAVKQLTELKEKRKQSIVHGDEARAKRKTLSKDIGSFMKANKREEAEHLKRQVEEANKQAEEADRALEVIDRDINHIFSLIPNLLDDRVPEGKDDSDNKIVHSWNEDKRTIGEGYLWHDELAVGLGGIDHD
eukprot:gene15616-19773_t